MSDNIQEAFWLTSADRQQLLYVSPAFETIWGYPCEKLYTDSSDYSVLMVNSIHPSDKERVVSTFSQNYQNECTAEYRIVRPDGEIRWVRSRSFPVQNPFGEISAIAGLSEDITERQQAEERLHQREQAFKALVENASDIISRFDQQLRHIYVNPALELATGIPPQEFLGKTHRELGMPQALSSLWETSLQQVFQTGEPDEHEFSYLTPQGWKYYQSRLCPEFAIDGSVESVIGIARDITENKQTEEALRESEQRFRSVFEFAPIGIATCNQEGLFLQVNQAFQEIVGYTEAELQNLTCRELTHPDDCAMSVKLFEELLTGKCPHISQEKRYLRKDGRVVWLNVSVSAIYDANGSFQYAIAMLQDISDIYSELCLRKQAELDLQKTHDQLEKRVAERTTLLEKTNTLLLAEIAERKQAEEELKAQKEFLQTVLETDPNLIYVIDREDKVILANQAVADFFGITVENLLGKTNPQLHSSSIHAQQCIAQNQEVLTTLQQTFIPEEAFPHSSGEVHWFQTIKKPLFSADGRVGGVFGVSTDITQRKLAQEALRLSEARFRLAIDNIPDVFVLYDAQRRLQFVNTEGLRRSGKSLEEHLGYTDEEIWGDEVTNEYLPILKRAVETRTLQTRECNIFLPTIGKFTHIITYVPLLDEAGNIYQILGITHDITARKQAEIQIKESLQEKEVLLKEIHHRVKNNLQVISSLLDLQSQYLNDRAMLEVFRESCNRVRAMALVHEQLYQSKDCAKINCVEYFQGLTNYLFRVYGVNANTINLEVDIDELTLDINTAIPCGLIINELVSNALKYAFPEDRAGRLKVAFHSLSNNNQLILTVKDNGIGFSRDWEVKQVKSLGLQLVMVLTNQLEGTLEIDRDGGTEFRVIFSDTSS